MIFVVSVFFLLQTSDTYTVGTPVIVDGSSLKAVLCNIILIYYIRHNVVGE